MTDECATNRLAFGIEKLDLALGGGLLPGTLTVVAGATGIGKTQLGLHWADSGMKGEGRRGIVCDLTSRGDPQNHLAYASRLFGWNLSDYPLITAPDFASVWDFGSFDRRLSASDRSHGAPGDAR